MILKGWNLFEKILLFGSILFISLTGLVFHADLLATLCSILGVITVLLLAKGNNYVNVLGVLISILYSIVSYRNKYYGEILIYIFLMMPMYTIGIFTWLRHKNKDTDSVEINTISKREWILTLLVSCIIFVGIYNLLKAFNTNALYLSSISVLFNLYAIYLQVRRSRFSFCFYLVTDILLLALWIIPVINGNYVFIPLILNPIINFISDSYGLYNWRRTEYIQRNSKLNI